MAEEWSERRTIVNEYVDAVVAASGIRPWADLVEEMISEGQVLAGSRIEELGKREQDDRCKEREQQDDRAWQGEPAGRQTGEEQYEEFVPGDGQPVDEDVQSVGRSRPFGHDEEDMDDDHGYRRTNEE
jgi:hypothetical protein